MKSGIVGIRNNLADALNRVAYGGERVILERRGKPIAAIVSIEDVELLERLEDEIDLKAVRKARKEGGKPVPLEKVAAELGIGLKSPPTRKRRSG